MATDTQHQRFFFAKDISGTVAAGRQQVDIQWRAGTFLVDEPRSNGGQDLGPDPFTLIIAGFVGCTLTTMRMYIRRKGWDVHDITVSANMHQQQEPFKTSIARTVVIGDAITDEQREKLYSIAKNCPVAKWLEGEVEIETLLRAPAA